MACDVSWKKFRLEDGSVFGAKLGGKRFWDYFREGFCEILLVNRLKLM